MQLTHRDDAFNRLLFSKADRVLCNNVILPGEYNPHHVRLWVVTTTYGPIGAVWATSEENALGELVDADMANSILVDPNPSLGGNRYCDDSSGERCEHARLGNASECADLDNVHCYPLELTFETDGYLLARFAEARGAGQDSLAG